MRQFDAGKATRALAVTRRASLQTSCDAVLAEHGTGASRLYADAELALVLQKLERDVDVAGALEYFYA